MDNPHERDTQTAEEVMELARQASDKSSRSRINNQRLDSMIMSLRLIANHPFLTDKTPMANVGSEEWMKDVVAVSGKMMLLDRMLPKLFAEGHKVRAGLSSTEALAKLSSSIQVLIFSQFTTQVRYYLSSSLCSTADAFLFSSKSLPLGPTLSTVGVTTRLEAAARPIRRRSMILTLTRMRTVGAAYLCCLDVEPDRRFVTQLASSSCSLRALEESGST